MPLNSWIITASPGTDIDLVEDIGFVRRSDRQAERIAETGGEDEQPDQRPDEGREEPLLLVDEEAQQLPAHDDGERDEVAAGIEPAAHGGSGSSRRSCDLPRIVGPTLRGSSGGTPSRGTEGSLKLPARPRATIRPRCSTTTRSSASISSKMCVAQSTDSPSSRTSARTMADDVGGESRSSPTVGSSRSKRSGAWISARAISIRRDWPPDSVRILSSRRSARPMRVKERVDPLQRRLAGDAVEGGVVEQVLAHRQVGVEGAGLEHHAEAGERLRRLPIQVVPEQRDPSGLAGIEPRHHREQGGLAGPFGPSNATKAARGTSNDTSSSAVRAPKRWLTPSTARAALIDSSPCGRRAPRPGTRRIPSRRAPARRCAAPS